MHKNQGFKQEFKFSVKLSFSTIYKKRMQHFCCFCDFISINEIQKTPCSQIATDAKRK